MMVKGVGTRGDSIAAPEGDSIAAAGRPRLSQWHSDSDNCTSLKLGSVVIGRVQKWSTGPVGQWTAICALPGIRTTLGHKKDKQSAMDTVVKAIRKWEAMTGVGLL